jgi:hypothetical protein
MLCTKYYHNATSIPLKKKEVNVCRGFNNVDGKKSSVLERNEVQLNS